jgi:hypothetical protein
MGFSDISEAEFIASGISDIKYSSWQATAKEPLFFKHQSSDWYISKFPLFDCALRPFDVFKKMGP